VVVPFVGPSAGGQNAHCSDGDKTEVCTAGARDSADFSAKGKAPANGFLGSHVLLNVGHVALQGECLPAHMHGTQDM
jgi:hypothetical protein